VSWSRSSTTQAQPPIARASALVRLERWLTAATLPKVTQALDDTDPIVRLAAVDALSAATGETRRQFLPRMLQDPVRAIRIEAARALAGPPADALRDAERSGFERAIDEYIAVQVYNADQPEGRTNLANIHALRGDAERAIAHYRKAIDLDPTFIPAYANLADFYRSQGAEKKRRRRYVRGCPQSDAAPLHHALGLALARQQRKAAALVEFAEAVKLNRQSRATPMSTPSH
jgi:tetratricopeptide (TPR) repeat protein